MSSGPGAGPLRLAAALTAALVTTSSAGCSAGGGNDGGGEESAEEVLTQEQARETYSDLATGLDAALDPFYDEYNRASPSVPALQDAAGDVARASEDFAAHLSGIAWPKEVDAEDVSAVVADYELYATRWEDVAAATSLRRVEGLLCEMDADSDTSADILNRLREDLDLEPVEWGDGDSSCGYLSGDRVTP